MTARAARPPRRAPAGRPRAPRRPPRPVDIAEVIRRLRRTRHAWNPTAPAELADAGDPFRVLIACILSLRTQDTTTGPAAARLFAGAGTPAGPLELTPARIAELIYPVGFYRTKAQVILGICRDLLAQHGGRVPDTTDELLTTGGVRRQNTQLLG